MKAEQKLDLWKLKKKKPKIHPLRAVESVFPKCVGAKGWRGDRGMGWREQKILFFRIFLGDSNCQ